MEVSAWKGGQGQGVYGIRVGYSNRNSHFKRSWAEIEVKLDDEFFHRFALTPGFWNKCPEFRDRGAPVIRHWLRRHDLIDWPKQKPPRFELTPIGGNRFELSVVEGGPG